MKLVIGRGNSRQVYEIPCAHILNRAPAAEVQKLVENVCERLGLYGAIR